MKRHLIIALVLALLPLKVAAAGDIPDELAFTPAGDLAGRYHVPDRPTDSIDVDIKAVEAQKVTFAGLHDDWKGDVTPADDNNPPKITLTRTPTAAQMDASVPEWARKEVEGKLKWRMELEYHDCNNMLEGKFYPGEIKWHEERDKTTHEILRKSAFVSGDGTPRSVGWERNERDPQLADVEFHPSLVIAPEGSPTAKIGLQALTLGQPFFPVVRMGPDLAKKTGDSLEVVLKAQKSGKSAKVTLTRYGGAKANPVFFTSAKPVVLGEPYMNLEDYINLKTSNGEAVTATYGDVQAGFVVYNSWVQAGIASNQNQLDQSQRFYQTLILDPRVPADHREAIHKKIQLVANERIYMSYVPKSDENFTDYSRYEVSAAYVTLVQQDNSGFQKMKGAVTDGYGVSPLFTEEAMAVSKALEAGRQHYRTGMWDMGKKLLFGTYEFIADNTGAGQFVTVAWGIDIYGNPVDTTDRVLAGIGLGSQLLLVGTQVASGVKSMQQTSLTASYEDAIKQWHANRLSGEPEIAPRAGNSAAVKAGSRPDFIYYEDSSKMKGATQDLRPTQEQFAMHPLDANDTAFKEGTAQKPMNSKGTPPQLYNDTCGVNVAEGILRDAGYPGMTEMEAVEFTKKHGYFEHAKVGQTNGQPHFVGTEGGMNVYQMANYLDNSGAFTKINMKPDMRWIAERMAKNEKVAVMINSGSLKDPGWHWVRVEGFSCGKDGMHIHIGDPWTGKSWAVRRSVFEPRINNAVSADFSQVTQFVR